MKIVYPSILFFQVLWQDLAYSTIRLFDQDTPLTEIYAVIIAIFLQLYSSHTLSTTKQAITSIHKVFVYLLHTTPHCFSQWFQKYPHRFFMPLSSPLPPLFQPFLPCVSTRTERDTHIPSCISYFSAPKSDSRLSVMLFHKLIAFSFHLPIF